MFSELKVDVCVFFQDFPALRLYSKVKYSSDKDITVDFDFFDVNEDKYNKFDEVKRKIFLDLKVLYFYQLNFGVFF